MANDITLREAILDVTGCDMNEVYGYEEMMDLLIMGFEKTYNGWIKNNQKVERKKIRSQQSNLRTKLNGKYDICTCDMCNGKFAFSDIEIHHVIPVSKGGDNNEKNLMFLCKDCHIKANKISFSES